MEEMMSLTVEVGSVNKKISVLCGNITDLTVPLDVMTVSAFKRDYYPTESSMIGALYKKDISVGRLSFDPFIDLRDICNIWLSHELDGDSKQIKRIGCIELKSWRIDSFQEESESSILNTIKSYFFMLDIAVNSGIRIESLGLPIVGTGDQGISDHLVMIPIINECLHFLERNNCIREIYIMGRSYEKAKKIADQLKSSYSLLQKSIESSAVELKQKESSLAFISYSSRDRNVADNLCSKLEANGIKVWYAPRNIDTSDYASSIVYAISKCSHFIVILSQASLNSEHVLNEIDLAFQETKRGIRFYPLKLDQEEMGPAFKYYLSRQHWMDATFPPLEKRLDEFVGKIKNEL